VIDCDVSGGNVFSPNGDGVNDIFRIKAEHVKGLHCDIFNRYGSKIFEWNDAKGGWDGTDNNSHKPVSDGTYYYVARVKGFDDKITVLKGFVEVLR